MSPNVIICNDIVNDILLYAWRDYFHGVFDIVYVNNPWYELGWDMAESAHCVDVAYCDDWTFTM